MKHTHSIFLVLALLVGAAISPLLVRSLVASPLPGLERPCIPAAGAATPVTCTAAASASASLTPESHWEVTCDQEAYVRTGTGSATAASGDFKYRGGATYYFGIGGDAGTNYFACRNVTTNGSCWLRECR